MQGGASMEWWIKFDLSDQGTFFYCSYALLSSSDANLCIVGNFVQNQEPPSEERISDIHLLCQWS